MATMEEYIRGLEQSASRVSALESKLASLQSQMLKQNEGMKKASKEVTKYEGLFTKLGNKIETFMSDTTNPVRNFARRIVYSFRGAYSALNKLNVTFRTTGKIWDNTIGKVISRTPVLGSIMGKVKGPKKSIMDMASDYGSYIQESGISATEGFLRLGGRKTRERGAARRAAIAGVFRKATGKDTTMNFANFFEQIEKNGDVLVNHSRKMAWIRKSGKTILTVFKIASRVLLKAMMFMIMTTAAIIGIVALGKILYNFLQGFADGVFTVFSGFYEDLKETFSVVWEGVQGIFGFLFGDTSFEEMIFGVLDSAYALLKLSINFSLRILGAFIVGLYKGLEVLFLKGLQIFKGLGLKAKIGVIVGAIVAVVAFLFGFPILMPALILGALYMFGKWFINKFDILANGGTVSSPLQIVGERGPEIASLPRGSRVFSNTQSKKMVSNAGTQINNYITINARDTSDGEMRRIAGKISTMVNNKINRTTSSRTMG